MWGGRHCSTITKRWTISNPSKRKGSDWEAEAAAYLTEALGTPVRRLAQHGRADLGDLDGVWLHAVECKAQQTLAIPEWIRQANREANNKGEPFGVVLVKRLRNKTADNWAILDIDTFARLIKRLKEAEGV